MTPIGFRNGQDELGCYVNSSFQVIFFNILFKTLIMNIDCEMFLANLDNSTDDYRCHLQKVMILQVVQQFFCEMLIGGKKLWTVMCFFHSLISGQILKIILQSLKVYLTKLCHREPLITKRYVTIILMTKEAYTLCQHTQNNSWA